MIDNFKDPLAGIVGMNFYLVVPAQRTVTYQDAHARSRPCAQSDLHSYVISDVLH